MPEINDIVRNYFGKHTLEKKHRDNLMEHYPLRTQPRYAKLATAIAVALILMVSSFGIQSYFEHVDASHRVTHEISQRFSQNLGIEVAFANFSDIQKKMPKLNLKLTESIRKSLPSEFNLEGGRYGLIHGQLVGQLSLIEKDNNRRCELYVSAAKGLLAKVPIGDRQYGNTRVTFWKEGGLIFALAEWTSG